MVLAKVYGCAYIARMSKSATINIRVSAEVKDALEAAAAADNRTLSNYILTCALRAAADLGRPTPGTPARPKRSQSRL
jgi:hypothetical protein